MANIRAMVVLLTTTAQPEQDQYVNTFHFSNADPFVTHASAVSTALQAFYTSAVPSTGTVGAHISPVVARGDATIKMYNLADPTPRVPTEVTFTLPATIGSGGLPEECAVVLSLKGDPPDTPRRRGRLYIGPLVSASQAFTPGSTTAFSSVTAGFRTVLGEAATRLAAHPGANWAIRSTVPAENFVPVTNGFIDDRFDTQRRRGPDELTRTAWT